MSEDVVKEQLEEREEREAQDPNIPADQKFKMAREGTMDLNEQIKEYREWYDEKLKDPDFQKLEIEDGSDATADQLKDIINDIKLGRNSDGVDAVPSNYTEPTDPNAPPMTR